MTFTFFNLLLSFYEQANAFLYVTHLVVKIRKAPYLISVPSYGSQGCSYRLFKTSQYFDFHLLTITRASVLTEPRNVQVFTFCIMLTGALRTHCCCCWRQHSDQVSQVEYRKILIPTSCFHQISTRLNHGCLLYNLRH